MRESGDKQEEKKREHGYRLRESGGKQEERKEKMVIG